MPLKDVGMKKKVSVSAKCPFLLSHHFDLALSTSDYKMTTLADTRFDFSSNIPSTTPHHSDPESLYLTLSSLPLTLSPPL